MVAVVAVLSEVVVAVLSEVDVAVSVRINSVRVRLGSPSASVATETTTVLPDLSIVMCGKGQFGVSMSSMACLSDRCWTRFGERLRQGVRSSSIARILGLVRSSTRDYKDLIPHAVVPPPSSKTNRSDLGASPDTASAIPRHDSP